MGANGDPLREVFRRVNDREFASLGAELIAPGFVRHDLADLFVGVEGQHGVQEFLAMLNAAAPDLRLTSSTPSTSTGWTTAESRRPGNSETDWDCAAPSDFVDPARRMSSGASFLPVSAQG
jgi:hypothetical protein